MRGRTRPGAAARRSGYLIAAAITAVMWYVINVWPGWRELSFLTADTAGVLWLVNLSFAVSIAVNLVYVVHDPPWFKALGDLVTTGIGLFVLVRLWRVFPFDFSGYSVDWAVPVRILLALALFGSIVGILVQTVTLVRVAVGGGASAGHRGEVTR
jgi:hypothetical protein